MSQQDMRNESIREDLPLLIKELTGLKEDDAKLLSMEQLARSVIRNHRVVCTNSHEVKRKIEGMQEKFNVNNLGEYAEYFGDLCEIIITHPLCLNHYEVDVHWSLIDFMITLAYNPIGAFRHNKHKFVLHPLEDCDQKDEEEAEKKSLTKLLEKDFIPMEYQIGSQSDSDLSNWSESSHSDSSNEPPTVTESEEDIKNMGMHGPEIPKHFTAFDSEHAKERLINSVQHSWWLDGYGRNGNGNDFATAYSRYIAKFKRNTAYKDDPMIVKEEFLLREIIWMFHSPIECKFFVPTENGIKIRKNVTVSSVSVDGLASFLVHEIVPYIENMMHLRNFLTSIYKCEDFTPPKTLECYAAGINALIRSVWDKLLEYEARVVTQPENEVITLMDMQQKLRGTLQMIERIDRVHQKVVPDLNTTPPHIATAHLLANLMHCYRTAAEASEANLAIALFLPSMKVYCAIIDTWWTQGRLEDWQQEFMVQLVGNAAQFYVEVRPFKQQQNGGTFVSSEVSERITKDACFKLLVQHCQDAGWTLNLLYDINRMINLSEASVIDKKLYDVFIEDVLHNVQLLQSVCRGNKDTPTRSSTPAPAPAPAPQLENGSDNLENGLNSDVAADTVDSAHKDLLAKINNFSTNDELLLLAFATDFNDMSLSAQTYKPEISALELFNQFEQIQSILPFEDIILTTLKRNLDKRIGFVNSFVMQMYHNEFGILQQIGVIRKVLLLEASDLMHEFYSKLFEQIEAGHEWENPTSLSTQLDDMVCSKLPGKFNCEFQFEINSAHRCRNRKVSEAVDELIVLCNFPSEIAYVIKPKNIQMYNEVFRFLLKVKWGLSVLENMKFSTARKRRKPYAPFEMIDLLCRRLEQLRFWMLFAVQTINFHLMTHVLQAMGEQLDKKIMASSTLKEIEMVHESYLETVCKHCFLRGEILSTIKMGIEQLLNLILILRLEWECCTNFLDRCNNPLDVESDDSSDSKDHYEDYLLNSQVDAIEMTYIRCHQYLANKLNNEVYLRQNTFLSGLSAAFNTSLPY